MEVTIYVFRKCILALKNEQNRCDLQGSGYVHMNTSTILDAKASFK